MERCASSSAPPIQGVGDFIRYMALAHQLPIYLSHWPSDLGQGTPVGDLTKTERATLDTIVALGGRVTASCLAAIESIKPSAGHKQIGESRSRRLSCPTAAWTT